MKRIIRMSPAEYINEPGVLKQLPDLLSKYSIAKPVVLTDETVFPIIKEYLPEGFLDNHPVEYFRGSCTFEEIERLRKQLTDYDGLLAFGGGQLIDTAKMVADRLRIKLVNVQTVPSNCAAIATKSIIYSEVGHEKIANVRLKKTIDAVLLEPDILKNAPKEYILSGIGDTLAKYYEIRRRITDDKLGNVSSRIGRFYIDLCREEMLKVESIEELGVKELQNLFDTIFLVAASVDGISDSDGRSVIAHAFYNAYVKIYPNYTKTHGEVVALGSLLQIFIEGDSSKHLRYEIEDYHKIIGLPRSLREIGIEKQAEIEAIADYISNPEDSRVRSVFGDLTYDDVLQALNEIRG